jgi:hypothetical protein
MRGRSAPAVLPLLTLLVSLLQLWHSAAEITETQASKCEDSGPFPCTEDGCPAQSLSCAELATQQVGGTRLCKLPFTAAWESVPSGTDGFIVSDLCPRACGTCTPAGPDEGVALAEWLRSVGPDELEPGLSGHSDEQAYVSRDRFGGRGLFARRNMTRGEVVHVVRTSHLMGEWEDAEEVLTQRAVRQVLRILRGAGMGESARARAAAAYVPLLPRYEDLYALPELWADEELAWLQDERITQLAREVPWPSTLATWHASLAAESIDEYNVSAWGSMPLQLYEVHWARALLQSRPLKIGSGTDSDPMRYYLIPFVDMLNTQLVAGDGINVKLQSFRAGHAPEGEGTHAGHRPRAVLTAARDIAIGEELLFDYGLSLRITSVRFALLNYGIIGNSGDDHFREASLQRDASGRPLCQPLWCFDDGPTHGSMTAAHNANRFGEWLRVLRLQLNSWPWNASTVETDARELIDARRELHDIERRHHRELARASAQFDFDPALLRARRRVVALEYRLGCKLGAVSAVDTMQEELRHRSGAGRDEL